MARVVVVGAGVSGLAAAARLARLRHDVVVCERNPGPGGQAGRFERDGFAFDTGPTLVQLPAGMRDLFIKTGKTAPLESVLDLRPVDPAVRWCFADGTVLDLPTSRGGATAALAAALSPAAAKSWHAFLAEGDTVWEQFRQGFITGPPAAVSGRRRRPKEERRQLAALRPAGSLPDLIQRHISDARLRQAAAAYSLRLGSDPRTAPSGAVLWPWLEQTFGSWEVVGGMRVLIDAIAERAALRGAVLRYDSEVVRVHRDDDRISAVQLVDGERLPADVVVAAVDDHVLAGLVGDQPSPAPRSCSMVTLLVALRGTADLGASTVSFPADPHAELRSIFDDDPIDADPTLYLSRGVAPAGCTALTVSAAARVGTTIMPASLLAALDARGHVPSDRLLWCEIRTPMDLQRSTGAPGGSIAGPALVGRDGLLRAPNATGVGGLYHVGATAHPGPGLALAPLSAALVAETLGRSR